MSRTALGVLTAAVVAGCQAAPRQADSSRQQDLEATSMAPMAAAPSFYEFVGWVPFAGLERAGAARRLPASADRLTVMSFNMHHEDEPAQLAVFADNVEALRRAPDFVLCQEVLFKRRNRRRGNTAAVLADKLGYHARGTKRMSDREGVAIVSRWPFAHYEKLHLRSRTSALLAGFRRVSVMGEFIVPALGRVRVVNVHLAYQPWEHHIRRKQLRETLEWMAARERKVHADVVILGGDFNMKPHRKEFGLLYDDALAGGRAFLDANTDAPTHGGRDPHKRVDYIFVCPGDRSIAAVAERVLYRDGIWWPDGSGRFRPSDHLPVLHDYAFEPAESVAVGALRD